MRSAVVWLVTAVLVLMTATQALAAPPAPALPAASGPSGVTVTTAPGQADIRWTPAEGLVGYYEIYRDGTEVGLSVDPRYVDVHVPGGVHVYQVATSGPDSPRSDPVSATVPPTAIETLYLGLGGASGALGPPTSEENGWGYGAVRRYANGWITLAPGASAAHYVVGTVLDRYLAANGPNGVLGWPTGDPVCGQRDGGCFQFFQGGTYFSSPTSGTHLTAAAFRDTYAGLGWHNGALGYPLDDSSCSQRDGGCFQFFQGGTLFWSARTGTHVTSGAFRDKYNALGWHNGALGYPLDDGFCGQRDGGCFQFFQGGTLFWSPGTGVAVTAAAFRDTYAAMGWHDGSLGYPLSDGTCGQADGGCFQFFQRGMLLWSAATGMHLTNGELARKYGELRWQNGPLGYPTSDPYPVAGGAAQAFQRGTIVWTQKWGQTTVSYHG